MIFSFIEKISYTLANELRSECKKFLNELQFIIETNKDLDKWVNENKEVIIFLLELSVFYRKIIVPLKGTAEFGLELPYSLIVGSDVLTKEELKNMENIVAIFEEILSRYRITPCLLDFGDIEEFLYKLKNFEKEYNE